MHDVPQFQAGARAGRKFGRTTATDEQLRSLEQIQPLAESELFSASLLANEVYWSIYPEHTDDELASWQFWRGIGGELVGCDFVKGFVAGAVSILDECHDLPVCASARSKT